MKTLLAYLLFFLTIMARAQQAVGPGDGGGGGAYVCRNPDGSIKSSMLVDLWEAERTTFNGRKLKIKYSDEDPHAQFERAMDKLREQDPELADVVAQEKENIFRRAEMLADDEEIPVPDDLKTRRNPKGCSATGMMYYEEDSKYFAGDSDKLVVDKEIFKALRTKTDIAAAWAHEAIYKVFRDRKGQRDSKLTRRLVGCLFSDGKDCLQPQKKNLLHGQLGYHCKDDQVDVTLVPTIYSTSYNGYVITKNKPENVPSDDFMRAYVHGMDGLKIPHGLTTALKLGDKTSEKETTGPLSDYGYQTDLTLRAEMDAPGKVMLIGYGYQSRSGRFGSGAFFANVKIRCRPVWGGPDNTTVIDGKYAAEYVAPDLGKNYDARDGKATKGSTSAQ